MSGRGKGRNGSGGSGDRPVGSGRKLYTRVKTARGRKTSSTRWLQRQLNDPYVLEAHKRGYRSRAAFKLLELDDRFSLLRPGMRVVDLGAAPGGWTQVAVARTQAGLPPGQQPSGPHPSGHPEQDQTGQDQTGQDQDGQNQDAATEPSAPPPAPHPHGHKRGKSKAAGLVVGLDILEWEEVPGAICLTLDFMDPAAPDLLRHHCGGPVDLVLSDMAAPTTGHPHTDHLRIMALADAAWEFAEHVLAPGGSFVCKVFQGGTEGTLLARMKQLCTTVKHAKPPASRKDSAEIYVVAQGFKGLPEDPSDSSE